ncbi:hypothetical protein ACWGI0_30985, partial [Streptomyces sp. NPDC054802]
MRSARILLASATATAALVITAPGAYALAAAADSDKDDSSYSSDHGKSDKDWGKDKGGKPHGGMHTGGGALASVSEDHKDWDKD